MEVEIDTNVLGEEAWVSVDGNEANMDGSHLRAFFAGDISTETEQLLLEKGGIDGVWLYKASHHGSKYSNSLELLEVLQPEISVISCSARNVYGHPHKEATHRMEEAGSELFYTMENGQVTIRLLQ